jgi:hypothetical protein
MDDRLEKEFYKSSWQRVLPVGPDGMQPLVRADRPAPRHGLAAMLRSLTQGVSAFGRGLGAFGSFGRWGATRSAWPAKAAHATRSRQHPSVRLSRAAPRTAPAGPTRRRPLRKAA